MIKRIRNAIKAIERLEAKRRRLVQRLLTDEPLLQGSLSLVNRTCGKQNCHCATRPAHPAWVLATSESRRRRCQIVRQDDAEEVQRRVATYKDYRVTLRAVEATQKELKRLLRGLMDKRDVRYQ